MNKLRLKKSLLLVMIIAFIGMSALTAVGCKEGTLYYRVTWTTAAPYTGVLINATVDGELVANNSYVEQGSNIRFTWTDVKVGDTIRVRHGNETLAENLSHNGYFVFFNVAEATTFNFTVIAAQ